MSTFSENTKNNKITFVIILGIAIALRLLGLNRGIWVDEGLSIGVISSDDFWGALRTNDHPFLYFLILKLWALIRYDEWFLRLPTIALGVATIAVFMKWMERYSRLASILAGALMATMPIMIRYSQEIRHYQLLLLATALCFLYASRIIASPFKPRDFLLLSLSMTLAVMSHLLGSMIVLTVFLYVIVVSRDKQTLWACLAAVAIPFGVFIFFRFYFLHHIPNAVNWWMPPMTLDLISAQLKIVFGYDQLMSSMRYICQPIGLSSSMAGLGIHLITVAFVVVIFLFGSWRQSWSFFFAAMTYWGQVVVFSIIGTPVFFYRTLLPGVIPFIGFTAMQCATIEKKQLRLTACVLVLMLSFMFAVHWMADGAWKPYERWREIAQILKTEKGPKDIIIFYPSFIEMPLKYYLGDFPPETTIRVHAGMGTKSLESDMDKLMKLRKEEREKSSAFLIVRHDLKVQKDKLTHDHVLSSLKDTFGEPKYKIKFGIIEVAKYMTKKQDAL